MRDGWPSIADCAAFFSPHTQADVPQPGYGALAPSHAGDIPQGKGGSRDVESFSPEFHRRYFSSFFLEDPPVAPLDVAAFTVFRCHVNGCFPADCAPFFRGSLRLAGLRRALEGLLHALPATPVVLFPSSNPPRLPSLTFLHISHAPLQEKNLSGTKNTYRPSPLSSVSAF